MAPLLSPIAWCLLDLLHIISYHNGYLTGANIKHLPLIIPCAQKAFFFSIVIYWCCKPVYAVGVVECWGHEDTARRRRVTFASRSAGTVLHYCVYVYFWVMIVKIWIHQTRRINETATEQSWPRQWDNWHCLKIPLHRMRNVFVSWGPTWLKSRF